MKMFFAVALWLVMGAVIGLGIILAIGGSPMLGLLMPKAFFLKMDGSPWLLIAGVLGFIVAVGRVCARSH